MMAYGLAGFAVLAHADIGDEKPRDLAELNLRHP